MRVVNCERVYKNKIENWYLAVIVSENDPVSSTVTGADVDGMDDGDQLAAGSVIITPTKNWVAFKDGEFAAKA